MEKYNLINSSLKLRFDLIKIKLILNLRLRKDGKIKF